MPSIMLIHGMFMNYECWEPWVARYTAQGRVCRALPWPGRDQPVSALRQRHPDPELARLTISAVVAELAAEIQQQPEPPLLIGHSMGGLVVQLLLAQGVGAAGVAIDSAPPQGVFTTAWSFVKANWPVINPLRSANQPYQMPFEAFQYAFVNGMPLEAQRAAYDRYTVPESLRVPRSSLGKAGRINFKQPHNPLLFIAGGDDHIIPAGLNRSNYRKYRPAAGVTEFKEFAGRNHFLIGQPGWEEIADYSLAWLEQHSTQRALQG